MSGKHTGRTPALSQNRKANVATEMKRKEFEKDSKGERYSDGEQARSDEERQRRHRHRQEKEDEEYRRRPADDRQRRNKYDDDKESRPKTIEYPSGHHRHYDSNAEDRR